MKKRERGLFCFNVTVGCPFEMKTQVEFDGLDSEVREKAFDS